LRGRFARLFARWWVTPRKKSGYWEYERCKKDIIQIKRFLNPSGENVWRLEPIYLRPSSAEEKRQTLDATPSSS